MANSSKLVACFLFPTITWGCIYRTTDGSKDGPSQNGDSGRDPTNEPPVSTLPEKKPDASTAKPVPEPNNPESGAGGADPGPMIGPPMVNSATPNSGPWGTEVRIVGSELGSADRAGSFLLIGENGLLRPDSEGIVSWGEDEIVLRVPFPHSGAISVETPQGSAVAGDFPAPWKLSAVQPVPVGTTVLASLSLGTGQLALALDTQPVSIIQFDGNAWHKSELPSAEVREATVRLYASEGVLKAFGVSDAALPEVIDFAFDGEQWLATPSGVQVTERLALAGGSAGGVVWFAEENNWSRARNTTGTWSIDKGPIVDPAPGDALRAAGATSDGSLYLARPKDTGNFLDDMEAPFIMQVPAIGSSFEPEFKVGVSVDDYLTDLRLVDRGRGLVVEYCGSDKDGLGLSGTAYRCYAAALTSAGFNLQSSAKETEFHAYHAASANKLVVGMCNKEAGSVLAEGETPMIATWLTWPCVEFGGVELDATGVPIVAVRYDGGFTVLLEPEGAPVDPEPTTDAGPAPLGDAGVE